MTTAELCTKYHVTQEQIDACQRWEDCGLNRIFYTVESQSQPGVYYKVVWNTQFHVLQCLPHTGKHCEASLKGIPCWHKRAALAAEQLFKAELRREQEILEREEAYRFEQMLYELERSQQELDAYLAEVDRKQAASQAS